jgi:regulator of cell morphogenesis and NO signaling
LSFICSVKLLIKKYTMKKLDVTQIEPRLKHPTIFEKFDALDKNEAMVIHNDHDPKPLYYQMIAERGNIFIWEYLLSGPEIWEVKITKTTEEEKIQTVGELVAADYRKAEVFRKYGIDFCCGGKRKVKEACEKKGVNYEQVEKELELLDTELANDVEDFNTWELDVLAEHIINKHHRYIIESTPILNELSAKVARVHGDRHPELYEIKRLYDEVRDELDVHMQKEEVVLFPYIQQLATADKTGTPLAPAPFGSIANPIRMMESEHELAGENISEIQRLTQGYTPPEDACMSYRVLFSKLQEYEADLHQHIHLENNILFKKAVELEAKLQN